MRAFFAMITALALVAFMGFVFLAALPMMGYRIRLLQDAGIFYDGPRFMFFSPMATMSAASLFGLALLLIFPLLLALPFLLLRGGRKAERAAEERSARDEETIRKLWDLQNRLEQRIENLETILIHKSEHEHQLR